MFLCDNQWKFWTFSIIKFLKWIFCKTETFFKKLENRFETTKIENASFLYKTEKIYEISKNTFFDRKPLLAASLLCLQQNYSPRDLQGCRKVWDFRRPKSMKGIYNIHEVKNA